MMTQAFYTGISGIKSNQTGIDVITDNLANISTIGFRGYSAEFASMFETSLNTTYNISDGVGVGTKVSSNNMDKVSGDIILSDRSTDLAIMENGWFGLINGNDTVYTRAGDFYFDGDSDLVSSDGHYVLGTMGGNINADNQLTKVLDKVALGEVTAQEKLNFPQTLTYPAEASTNAKFIGNIGFDDEIRTMGATIVDKNDDKNHLKLSFSQVVPQVSPGSQWDVVATSQTIDGTTIYDTQTGVVGFDARGALESNTLPDIDNNGSMVKIDLGSGFDGVVAINNIPISSSSKADGTIGGDLMGYEINKNAEVIATFTNGFQSSVGKIAIFHFQNEQGLERASGSKFYEGTNSGSPIFYKDENGNNIIGTDIANYHLESSNIRMDAGLTDLIIFQRAFDANSKCITTADQMMQKALQMDA